jgi:NAD(P)-dependent dehydrogenase (short-subunit alcohol dehydrogenase family)
MTKDRFEGKIILVTGGNSGIGLATAQRLLSEGATVIITGRDGEKLKKAVQSLGNKVEGIVSDIAKLSDIESLYAQIKAKYGRLDGLFANAGIGIMGPVESVTEKDVDDLLAINIKGTFFTVQKAIPLFSKGASVVLNASSSGSKGVVFMAVYGATKAAVRSMARAFSLALLDRGVRVNVVSPGPVDTPIWDGFSKDQLESRMKANPAKRFGKPEEVAAAVAYLLADESAYVVGAEVPVDGGVTQL